MQELIERQAALRLCKDADWKDDEDFIVGYNYAMREMAESIEELPTIEAKPVRYGRWETINPLYSNVYCSECGAASDKYLAKRYKGCPFCLCVMDATDTNVGGKGCADNG